MNGNADFPIQSERQSCVDLVVRKQSKVSDGKLGDIQTSIAWKVLDEKWCIVHENGKLTSLISTNSQKISMKNFLSEIRGLRDVNKLVGEAIITLDPDNPYISNLLEEILNKIRSRLSLNEDFVLEVKENIFMDEKVLIFSSTIQGCNGQLVGGESELEPTWLCAFCNASQLKRRIVAITRFKEPTNFGSSTTDVKFLILIFCPAKEKATKSALETGQTFGTLFSQVELRQKLLFANNEVEFKNLLLEWAQKLSEVPVKKVDETVGISFSFEKSTESYPGQGIKNDFLRRFSHYASDYIDGVKDCRAIQKTISTSAFLYFACLLPTIAFGTLNDNTTNGIINVRKGIFTQAVGHLFFSFCGGQHLNILLTTAPLCLFVKIIYGLSEYFNIVNQFPEFYCCVGLWCSFFLFLSAVFNVSKIMKWCTRSTEEIFAIFISIAFVANSIKDVFQSFSDNYDCTKEVVGIYLSNETGINLNTTAYLTTEDLKMNRNCHRDSSLLFLILMLGTFWCGITLYNFKNTPFLHAFKRELVSDYALPIAVVLFSFIGSFIFKDIPEEKFKYNEDQQLFQIAQIQKLSWQIVLCSAVLGFSLCVLIFMDQNIGAATVNNPSNKLKKGSAYHWDLVIISIINTLCSLFTLPWLHAALPHAPMHVKNLAEIEENVDHGKVHQTVVQVRETRLTGIISHLLMGLSLFLLPYPLAYIPTSVFDGLYLYMGITALEGNHMFERTLLFFMEQMSYPPNHYIRSVPQRNIHQFTLIQIFQLILLCVLGFSPYPFIKVMFPLDLLLLLFFRHKILPKLIEQKYLDVLDPLGQTLP